MVAEEFVEESDPEDHNSSGRMTPFFEANRPVVRLGMVPIRACKGTENKGVLTRFDSGGVCKRSDVTKDAFGTRP